jgi:YgiT-type zinc finger domain-containing protein
MKCPICGSQLIQQREIARRVINSRKMIFANVPSLICQNEQCGQIFIDSINVAKLEKSGPYLTEAELINGYVDFNDLSERENKNILCT